MAVWARLPHCPQAGSLFVVAGLRLLENGLSDIVGGALDVAGVEVCQEWLLLGWTAACGWRRTTAGVGHGCWAAVLWVGRKLAAVLTGPYQSSGGRSLGQGAEVISAYVLL